MNYFFTETDKFTNRIEEIVGEMDLEEKIRNVISQMYEDIADSKEIASAIEHYVEYEYSPPEPESAPTIDDIVDSDEFQQIIEDFINEKITPYIKEVSEAVKLINEWMELQKNKKPWYKFW